RSSARVLTGPDPGSAHLQSRASPRVQQVAISVVPRWLPPKLPSYLFADRGDATHSSRQLSCRTRLSYFERMTRSPPDGSRELTASRVSTLPSWQAFGEGRA